MPVTKQSSGLSRFFRNPETGEIVVAQPPNPPLLVWLLATLVRVVLSPGGWMGTALSVLATVSIVIWAVLEIVRGDSPFRRVLGGVVLAFVALGLLLR